MSENSAPAESIPTAEERPWMTVPEAGLLFLGLGRSGSYEAARRGDLPIIKVGSRYVVPTAAMRRMMGMDVGVPA